MPYQPNLQNPFDSLVNFSNQLKSIRENAARASNNELVQKRIERDETALLALQRQEQAQIGVVQAFIDDATMSWGRDGVEKTVAIAAGLYGLPGAGLKPIFSPDGVMDTSYATGLYSKSPKLLRDIQNVRQEFNQPNFELTNSYETWREKQELAPANVQVSREMLYRHAMSGVDTDFGRWAKSVIEESLNGSDLTLDYMTKINMATGGKRFSIAQVDGKIKLLTGEDKVIYDNAKKRAGETGQNYTTVYKVLQEQNKRQALMHDKFKIPASHLADIGGVGTVGSMGGEGEDGGAQPANFYAGKLAERISYKDAGSEKPVFGTTPEQKRMGYSRLASLNEDSLSWVYDVGLTADTLVQAESMDRATRQMDNTTRKYFMAEYRKQSEQFDHATAMQHAYTISSFPDYRDSQRYSSYLEKGVRSPEAANSLVEMQKRGVNVNALLVNPQKVKGLDNVLSDPSNNLAVRMLMPPEGTTTDPAFYETLMTKLIPWQSYETGVTDLDRQYIGLVGMQIQAAARDKKITSNEILSMANLLAKESDAALEKNEKENRILALGSATELLDTIKIPTAKRAIKEGQTITTQDIDQQLSGTLSTTRSTDAFGVSSAGGLTGGALDKTTFEGVNSNIISAEEELPLPSRVLEESNRYLEAVYAGRGGAQLQAEFIRMGGLKDDEKREAAISRFFVLARSGVTDEGHLAVLKQAEDTFKLAGGVDSRIMKNNLDTQRLIDADVKVTKNRVTSEGGFDYVRDLEEGGIFREYKDGTREAVDINGPNNTKFQATSFKQVADALYIESMQEKRNPVHQALQVLKTESETEIPVTMKVESPKELLVPVVFDDGYETELQAMVKSGVDRVLYDQLSSSPSGRKMLLKAASDQRITQKVVTVENIPGISTYRSDMLNNIDSFLKASENASMAGEDFFLWNTSEEVENFLEFLGQNELIPGRLSNPSMTSVYDFEGADIKTGWRVAALPARGGLAALDVIQSTAYQVFRKPAEAGTKAWRGLYKYGSKLITGEEKTTANSKKFDGYAFTGPGFDVMRGNFPVLTAEQRAIARNHRAILQSTAEAQSARMTGGTERRNRREGTEE
jgi:hypothetical protein